MQNRKIADLKRRSAPNSDNHGNRPDKERFPVSANNAEFSRFFHSACNALTGILYGIKSFRRKGSFKTRHAAIYFAGAPHIPQRDHRQSDSQMQPITALHAKCRFSLKHSTFRQVISANGDSLANRLRQLPQTFPV